MLAIMQNPAGTVDVVKQAVWWGKMTGNLFRRGAKSPPVSLLDEMGLGPAFQASYMGHGMGTPISPQSLLSASGVGGSGAAAAGKGIAVKPPGGLGQWIVSHPKTTAGAGVAVGAGIMGLLSAKQPPPPPGKQPPPPPGGSSVPKTDQTGIGDWLWDNKLPIGLGGGLGLMGLLAAGRKKDDDEEE